MAYAYHYPQPTGYVAAPSAMYYYQPGAAPAVGYVQHHNPQFVQYVQQHPDQALVNQSATNIQRLARGFTERLSRQLEPPQTGSVVVAVHGATGIRNAQCCFTQSPYAVVTYGKESHRTEPHSRGGRYPEFEKQQPAAFAFVPEEKHVKVELVNSNMFCDDPLGYALIPTEDLWKAVNERAEPREYELVGKHGKGNVRVTAFYVPPLHVTIHRCKDLHDVQSVGKQDPYVSIQVPGSVGVQKQRTSVCRDGHKSPKWEGAGATHTFLLRHQWHLQRPRTEEEKDDEEARPTGPGMTFRVVNLNHVKNQDIAHVRIPWELTLKTWLRGAVWTELTRGSPKGKKEASGGFIAWSISGGPTVREEEEREQESFQPQQFGMQPMPSGPVPAHAHLLPQPSQQQQPVMMSSSQSYH